MVLIVDVKDQSTGEFGVGGGYSNNDGFTATVDITERNFLGRGQFIRASVGGGTDSREYTLSFTEPYFLGYRLAAGFDVFKNTDSSYNGFEEDTQGINLRLGAPITEDIYLSTAFKFSETRYTGIGAIASNPELNAVTRTVNNGGHQIAALSYTLTYNTLDDQKLPREGIAARLTQEYAGLGFDNRSISRRARKGRTNSDSCQNRPTDQARSPSEGGQPSSPKKPRRICAYLINLFLVKETIRGL